MSSAVLRLASDSISPSSCCARLCLFSDDTMATTAATTAAAMRAYTLVNAAVLVFSSVIITF